MRTYRGIFFDFDYTLGDATDCIVAGFRYAFARLGLPEPEYEAVRYTIGMTLENAYTLLSGDGDAGRQAEFRRLYVEKANPLQVKETRLFPGAVELLDRLKADGVTVAIVSTKRSDVIYDILANKNLSDRVAFVVGGSDVAHPKPAPDAALLALSKAGSKRSEALFVGDTVIDAETACRAGLDVRRQGSAALDLCSVAAGRAGVYFELQVSLWDYAAGALIVSEAGGRVTDIHGSPLPFDGSKPTILAASPENSCSFLEMANS